MAGTVILAALIVFTCCLNIVVEAARVLDRTDLAAAAGETITTELPPASNIEDPTNSATTSDSGEDEICFRCYESVKIAQSSIAIQLDLVNKQNKLIKQQNKAAAAAAAAFSSSSTTPSPSYTTTTAPLVSVRKPTKQQRNQRGENSTTTTSTIASSTPNTRIRSLENHEPIVVSRLRVARSADLQQQRLASGQLELGSRGFRRNQHPKSVKEPALKQLKHKQEQQLNETCKSLYEAQQCLNGISRECLGDLQFHSQEVYMKQWLGKLNCAPINDPTLRPYKWITRTIPRIQEPEKVPIPRPISSQEEIQKRLDAMFGGRSRSPIGVMLKPTLTSSASQKFNSLLESVQQQQILQGGPSADSYSVKGRHLLSANEVMASNFYGHHQNDQSQPEGGQLLAMTSQLLLVPAFLILIVLFVTLTSRYIKQIR